MSTDPYEIPRKLHTVTLTGADDSVVSAPRGCDRMLDLSQRYPYVEWGILFGSEARTGEPRYPLAPPLVLGCRFAAHLCGSQARRFLMGASNIQHVIRDRKYWRRVQINFSGDEAYNLAGMHELMRRLRDAGIRTVLQKKPGTGHLLSKLWAAGAEFDTLMDASGGRGIEPDEWPAPSYFSGAIGYAGGLRADIGLQEQLKAIIPSVGPYQFGIDMESSLRTPTHTGSLNDFFDLDKCELVLKLCQPWISGEAS